MRLQASPEVLRLARIAAVDADIGVRLAWRRVVLPCIRVGVEYDLGRRRAFVGRPIRNIILEINIKTCVSLVMMRWEGQVDILRTGKERLAGLTHDGCETAELHDVAEYEQEGVEDFFLFGGVAASGEEEDEQGDYTEGGENQVEDVKGGFPELLGWVRWIEWRVGHSPCRMRETGPRPRQSLPC